MTDYRYCQMNDEPLNRDGKCWGVVDVVDEEDGCGIFMCEGHKEFHLYGKYLEDDE